MAHATFLLLSLLVSAADAPDPKALAQELLTKGAALFDTRNAQAMAATYVENAQITLFAKDSNSDGYKVETYQGRPAIEKGYADLFKDKEPTTSRNEIEDARLLGPDMLLIRGKFKPNVDQDLEVPFTQLRAKQGDTWRILGLHLYVPGQ